MGKNPNHANGQSGAKECQVVRKDFPVGPSERAWNLYLIVNT